MLTYTVLSVDGGTVYAVGSDGNVYRWIGTWTLYAQVKP